MHRRGRRGVLLLVLFGLVGLVGTVLWVQNSPPLPTLEPPLPDLGNLEPALKKKLSEVATQVEGQPESAEAWGRLGMVLDVHEMSTEAVVCYERAQLLSPEDYRWPYFLGVKRIWDQQGALEHLRRAAELNPDYAPIQVYLGNGFLLSEELPEAEAAFQRARTLDAGLIWAHIGLAKVAQARSDPQASLGHLKRALQLGPHAGEVYWLLSNVYRRLGEIDNAEKNEQRATGRPILEPLPDPVRDALWWREGVTLRWRRARSERYLQQGRLPEAIAEWQQMLEEDPDSAEAHFELGFAYGQGAQLDDSLRHYERAIALKSDHAKTHQNRGIILLRKQRSDEALVAFQRALELDPNLHKAKNNLGALLIRKGQVKVGLDYLRQSSVAMPRNADVQFKLATALRSYGNPEEAAAAFERALRADPGHLRARFEYGVLLGRMGRFQEAATAFQKVVTAQPGRRSAHINLGHALLESRQYEEAIAAYRVALTQFPGDAQLLNKLAWLFATCPEMSHRNGPEALSLAKELCKKSNYRDARHLDTLAAAHAESADFGSAVRYAQQALDLLDMKDVKNKSTIHGIFRRLNQYKNEMPYFDDPQPANHR